MAGDPGVLSLGHSSAPIHMIQDAGSYPPTPRSDLERVVYIPCPPSTVAHGQEPGCLQKQLLSHCPFLCVGVKV